MLPSVLLRIVSFIIWLKFYFKHGLKSGKWNLIHPNVYTLQSLASIITLIIVNTYLTIWGLSCVIKAKAALALAQMSRMWFFQVMCSSKWYFAKGVSISAKPNCYKTFVRPILQYASPIWVPYLQVDISALEKGTTYCSLICTEWLLLEKQRYCYVKLTWLAYSRSYALQNLSYWSSIFITKPNIHIHQRSLTTFQATICQT